MSRSSLDATNSFSLLRRNSVPAERLPGLHQDSEHQWRQPGPGGEGQDDSGRQLRVPRLLQRLQQPLPQQGEVHREEQRLRVRLLAVSLRRNHL